MGPRLLVQTPTGPHTSPFLPTEASVLQLKLKALILDVIHNISVVRELGLAGVSSPEAWAWRRQLRFYLSQDKHCLLHMVDASFSYTYEYQVPGWRTHTGTHTHRHSHTGTHTLTKTHCEIHNS